MADGQVVIAADVFTFCDDLRPVGATKKESWHAGSRAASIDNWLGCQDAARTRRDSRQDPGAWAGCVVRTVGGVFGLVSEDKWDKMKRLLREMESMLDTIPDALPRHRLTVIRGFLIYLTQTYHYLIPSLTAIPIPIDGWRGNRAPDAGQLPAPKLPQRHNGL